MRLQKLLIFMVFLPGIAFADAISDADREAIDQMLLLVQMAQKCSITINDQTSEWIEVMTTDTREGDVQYAEKKAAIKVLQSDGKTVSVRACWSLRDTLHAQGWL